MDRIQDPTATADNKFQEAMGGNAATRLRALWLNGMQEELTSFIEEMGITLSSSDLTQLRQALDRRFPRQVSNITELRALTGLVDGQVIYMADHTSQGDGGGGEFVVVGDEFGETDNNGTLLVIDGKVVQRRNYSEATPAMFGAQVGTPSAVALQAWLDHGGVMNLDRDYTSEANLLKTLDGDIFLHGVGSITNTATTKCLSIENPHHLLTSLSSATADGVSVIPVASVTGIQSGDMCVIKSAKSWDASDPDYIAGEIAVVNKVVGSDVHLYSATRDSYLSADEVYFYRPYSVTVSGIRVYGDSSGTVTNQLGLEVSNLLCPTIADVSAVNFGGTGIRTGYCLSPSVDNCNAVSVYAEPGYAYGLALISCQGPTVNGGAFYSGRHGITHGGTIPCRNSQILNADVGSHDGIIALDAHSNTEGLMVIGGRAASLSLSGRDITIDGTSVDGFVNYYIPPDDYHPCNYFKMKNCTIRATGTTFNNVVRFYDNNNIGSESRLKSLVIDGCRIENAGHDLVGVYFQEPLSANTTHIEKVSIRGSSISMTGVNDAYALQIPNNLYISIEEIDIDSCQISTEAASTYTIRVTPDFSGALTIKNTEITNRNAAARSIECLGGSKVALDNLVVNLEAGTTFQPSITADVVEATNISVTGSPGRRAFNFSSSGELLANNIVADDASNQLDLIPDRTFYARTENNVVGRGSAAPTAGAWDRGDVIEARSPAASGFIGWVCVAAGTPGTWKTFGAISA